MGTERFTLASTVTPAPSQPAENRGRPLIVAAAQWLTARQGRPLNLRG